MPNPPFEPLTLSQEEWDYHEPCVFKAEAEAQAQAAADLRQRLEEVEKSLDARASAYEQMRAVAFRKDEEVTELRNQLAQAQKGRDCVKFELQAKESQRLKDNEYLLQRASQAEAALEDFEEWLQVADGGLHVSEVLAELQRRRSPIGQET